MKIEYCHCRNLNFGDDLNPWLWPQLLGDHLADDDGVIFLGIGTIINQTRFEKYLSQARKIVLFGSGASQGRLPIIDEQWQVYGVRGPDTARRLGLGNDKVIGDPAYLLHDLAGLPAPLSDRNRPVAFIPHHRSEDYTDWAPLCRAAGLRFISPRQPVETFLAQLRGCERVITEAMHGAICADALRIPWLPVSFSPGFNVQKWQDFLASMALSETLIHRLPFSINRIRVPGRYLEQTIKHGIRRLSGYLCQNGKQPFSFPWPFPRHKQALIETLAKLAEGDFTLSDDAQLAAILERQHQALDRLKADYPFCREHPSSRQANNIERNLWPTDAARTATVRVGGR